MSTQAKTRSPVLEVEALTAGYGNQPVIHDLGLHVEAGEIVTLLGANGVGKTTTMLAITGELPLMSGEVRFDGAVVRGPLYRRTRTGFGYVPEGRALFFGLTVRENLRVARADQEAVLALFPELEPRLDVRGGLLSGGEQQMLSLARALARKPRLLLVDELSLGLAPKIVRRLLSALRESAREADTGILFVEQHARKALLYADRGYVMRRGRIALEGSAGALRDRIAAIEDHYLTERVTDLAARSTDE